MAVIEVKLHSAGAGGNAQGRSAFDTKISLDCQYRVLCNSPLDTATTVLNYFYRTRSLPWPGRPFRFGTGFAPSIFCKTVQPKTVEKSGGWFDVSCSFEMLTLSDDDEEDKDEKGKNTKDPLEWHDDIDVGATQLTIPTEKAIFRQFLPPNINNRFFNRNKEMAIVNSALVPLDPTLEETIEVKVIRITRNSRSYNGQFYDKYRGKINKDYVTIQKPAYAFKESFSPYRGLVKNLDARFDIANGIPYWKETMEVWVHPLINGWRRIVLDRGRATRAMPGDRNAAGSIISDSDVKPGDPTVRANVDKDGLELTEPVNFDGDGKPLTAGKPPVFMVYSTKDEISFDGIRW